MRQALPDPHHFVGVTLPQFPNYAIIERVGKGSNGHVYRAHSEDVQGDLAFKFVPIENIRTNPTHTDLHLAEARKANVLDSSCVVPCIDVFRWAIEDLGREFFVFVSQYIPGVSLDKFIRKNRSAISVAFVEDFLSTMFDLLFELDGRGMAHGDLHAGNILVARSKYDLRGQATFKVTDFGIAEVTDTPHGSDYLYVANILRDLLACINYSEQESRNRYVFGILRHAFLERHLIETDSLADPLAQNAGKLYEKLISLDQQFRTATRQHSATQMVTPFDYPNCEQMGNSHLLLRSLYSDRLLGLPEIKARSNLVLTGPRGCGKTTVFRALSLDYMSSVGTDDPTSIQFIGVYYRCDDLYFSFPRYQTPSRVDALDIPMHFIVVSLIAETIKHVEAWAVNHFETEFRRNEPTVTDAIWSIVGLQKPQAPGMDRFAGLISKLVKQRDRAAKKQRLCHMQDQVIDGYLGPKALLEACSALRSGLPYLDERPFFYFIDDYSTPKITTSLQHNLNRLLMIRHADVFFKISTESPISFERRDVDGKQYVEEREYELLNLGLRYLQHEGSQVQNFLEDLFARRFREVDEFPCQSLAELLGDNPRNENETARLYRDRKANNTLFGVQTVTALCSGDIHYMIRLVRRMVEDSGGIEANGSTPSEFRISAASQSASIRAAAGEFLESVRNLPRRGSRLAMVVTAIGNVARSYMRYVDSMNVTGNPPHQASRIEPFERLDLSGDAQRLLEDLVRFSIILMDPRGKSRRGEVVPRFYLRRYLIPHFGLTFSKRDSLELNNQEIELLLTDPHSFQEMKRIRSSEDARARKWFDPNQGELFGEASE